MPMFYGEKISTKEDWMAKMAEHLSGSCMNHVDFEDGDYLPGIKEFEITEEEFEQYLIDHGIFECNDCGWWTYEGEGDGTYCDDCQENHAEEGYEPGWCER